MLYLPIANKNCKNKIKNLRKINDQLKKLLLALFVKEKQFY